MARTYFHRTAARNWLLVLCLVQGLLQGCDTFFDVRPNTSIVNPATLKDFQEMLNNDSLALCNFMLADFMSDDIRLEDAHLSADPTSSYTQAWLWGATVWQPGEEDKMYNSAYARILQMNIILDRIGRTAGKESDKEVVKAQALINRAWYYLQLANLYGAGYRESSAATDLSVPLILSPDAAVLPQRATVKAVYEQVTGDLRAALATSSLPDMGQDVLHPGKAAGFTLLARTCLYMGRYDDAQQAAEAALSAHDQLHKFTAEYAAPASLLDLSHNPEVMLARICNDYKFYGIRFTPFFIDPGLKELFGDNDLRRTVNFAGDLYITGSMYNSVTCDYSVGVPEAMLIRAECLARKNDKAGAMAIVNTLRENRLARFEPLDGGADVLKTVLEERRRELFCHGGLRLFDLKRLNSDNVYARTIFRKKDDGTTVLATLVPNSPRYLMPFSPVIIANNPGIIQNPR
ncbi:RagB/SusD family nutrient uptake outer membrane protein [Chitinophaga sp. NPDC101104]|uniref:RagB/SusD family nutrient uptake outer membrane protein n=1 Tax=Chitinophaga sp. NPDC101104 TaxID=3390561 RepID=UPI003D03CE51